MKNSKLNLLRGGVFLFAIIAAFAFTNPVPQGLILYGNDTEGEEVVYVPLTGLTEGTHYICDDQEPVPCIVTFSNNNPQTGQMTVVKDGQWIDLR